jgi:hypothetical protein
MKMGRRKFIALGITGLGSLSLMSLTACTARPTQSDEDEEFASSNNGEELERATTDWQTAFADAEKNWVDLQSSINDAESAIEDFKTKAITNPEALAELESLYQEAKDIRNQHKDMVLPVELTEILDAIEVIEDISSAYQQAIYELYVIRNNIIVFDPLNGEFEITDEVGYSYHIKYSAKSPIANVDTTLGIPGEVGVIVSVFPVTLTITNTTSGKRAPLPHLYGFTLLYPDGLLSGASASVDDGRSGTYNEITSDLEMALFPRASIQSNAGVRYECREDIIRILLDGYYEGRTLNIEKADFAVGESREYVEGGGLLGEVRETTYIIPEDKKDLLVDAVTKNVIGIAFHSDSDAFGTVGSLEQKKGFFYYYGKNVYYLSSALEQAMS